MNKRESLILKYLTATQNRMRLTYDHLLAEFTDIENDTDKLRKSYEVTPSNVADHLETYELLLKEIESQTHNVKWLLKEIKEKRKS